MSVYNFNDSLSLFIDDICNELGRKSDANQWKQILEDNLFTTCGDIATMDCEDWLSLGLPLITFSLMKKRINKTGQEHILLSDIHQEEPPRIDSFSDLSNFIKQGKDDTNKVKDKDSKKKTKRHHTRQKSLKGDNTETANINAKVFAIGDRDHSNVLLKILNNGEDCENGIYKQSVSVYGHDVNLEILDSSNENESVSVLILLFALEVLNSLRKMIAKYQQTLEKQDIVIPLLLVGISCPSDGHSHKSPSSLDISSAAEEMNVLQYFEVKNRYESKILLEELARIIIRDNVYPPSPKILETISKLQKEKKTFELTLKRKQLKVLPNQFLYYKHIIQQLRLDNNLFTYFPHAIFYCTQLKELSLNNNQITEIPILISRLKLLTKFMIESNKIEDIPLQIISRMESLNELKISGNPLSNLPFKLKSKSTLKQIREYTKKDSNENVPAAPPLKLEIKKRTLPPFDIFGVPLNDLMKNEFELFPYIPVPRIVRYTIKFIITKALNIEGIFRLAGEKVRCSQLRDEITKSDNIVFMENEVPHNICSILKSWLRELPEPVFLFSNYHKVLEFVDIPEDDVLPKLKGLIQTLPTVNYCISKQLFQLMYFVSLSSEINKMDASNITKVIGPNMLFLSQEQSTNLDPFLAITKTNQINDILSLYVKYYPEIFEQSFINIFESDYFQKESKNEQKVVLFRKVFGHTKSVVSCVLSSDNSLLWTADTGGTFKIWNSETMSVVHHFSTEKRTICVFRYDNKIWIGFGNSTEVRDEKTGDLLHSIDVPSFSLCFNEGKIYAASLDNAILVYDCNTFEQSKIETVAPPSLVSNINNSIWVVCFDKQIRIFNCDTNEFTGTIDISQCGRLNSLQLINGNVWAASDISIITVWDPSSLQLKTAIEGDHNGKIFGACVVGDHIWTYGWDSRICIYDYETLELLGDLPRYHTDAVGSIDCIYDNKLNCWKIYTASWDQSVCVWLSAPSKRGMPALQKQKPSTELLLDVVNTNDETVKPTTSPRHVLIPPRPIVPPRISPSVSPREETQ